MFFFKSLFIAIIFTASIGAGFSLAAEGAVPDVSIPKNVTTAQDFLSLFKTITNWIFTFALVIAVIFIVLAGFQFIAGGGSIVAVEQARRKIIYAIIGIALAALAAGIPWVIQNIIGS